MANEPLPFYKLTILYTLSRAENALSRSQLSDFLLEREYMTFINFSESIASLEETGLLTEESRGNRTLLHLTEEGKETIRFFENRLDASVREDIDRYLREQNLKLVDELAVETGYYRSAYDSYIAECIIHDGDSEAVHLKLSFPTEQLAQGACEKFPAKSNDIYAYLLKELM